MRHIAAQMASAVEHLVRTLLDRISVLEPRQSELYIGNVHVRGPKTWRADGSRRPPASAISGAHLIKCLARR